VFKGTIAREFWVGRCSEHAGLAQEDDGSFEEFDAGLRIEHSRHEMEYTPGVTDAVKICDWDFTKLDVEGWRNVTLEGKLASQSPWSG
jgi:hypothetical protein